MDREQAEAERARLAAEHPDATWMVREGEDGWEVLKVGLSPTESPQGSLTHSKPRPPEPDDPRTNHVRNVGGNYA
jgi:hypothetical protein